MFIIKASNGYFMSRSQNCFNLNWDTWTSNYNDHSVNIKNLSHARLLCKRVRYMYPNSSQRILFKK